MRKNVTAVIAALAVMICTVSGLSVYKNRSDNTEMLKPAASGGFVRVSDGFNADYGDGEQFVATSCRANADECTEDNSGNTSDGYVLPDSSAFFKNGGEKILAVPSSQDEDFTKNEMAASGGIFSFAANVKADNYTGFSDTYTGLETSDRLFDSGSRKRVFELTVIRRRVDTGTGRVSFDAIVKNNSSFSETPTLYYALYGSDGTLFGVKTVKQTVNPGENVIFSGETAFGINGDTMYTERVFLWNDSLKILSTLTDIGTGKPGQTCSSVELSQKVMSLRINDGVNTGHIWGEIFPDSYSNVRLKFKSLNPSVASVDEDGVVTALSNGETKIYVYTSDLGAYDVCTVTVSGFVTESVTLSHNEINMLTNGQYLLYADVRPEGHEAVIWTSSDTDVADVSQSGLITSNRRGRAVITASAGEISAECVVNVYSESDFTGSVAAHFESGDRPEAISSGSGDAGGKSYGCFQFSSNSNGPKSFYNWLINTGYNQSIGYRLKSAHEADGGYDKTFGENFDAEWRKIAAENKSEFRSCQLAYAKTSYYDDIYNRLKNGLGFDLNNYSIAIKSAVWSRAIQHGASGAYNVVSRGFEAIGGFTSKSERELIAAIYAESGAVVTSPPSSSSKAINDTTKTARENGLVGKYMKYYSANSSDIQVGVWVRLNINEPNMVYKLLDNPPVYITPQD